MTGTEKAPAFSLRIPLIVACAFFMENLDSTVIATAVPQMARSFGESPIALNAGVTVYMLTLAVFIPLSAWVADRFGPRNVFGSAIVLFTVASMLCGLSQSLPQFVAARALQGIGGAMMVPVGRIIVVRNAPKSQMLRAMAFLTWPALVGPIVGPSVGGFVATYSSWRWIFYMNVPMGILGAVLVWRLLSNQTAGAARSFDRRGFVLSSIALVSLMWGMGSLAQDQASYVQSAGLIAVALAIGGMTFRHMRTVAHPLIDLKPFRIATFFETCLGGGFSRFAISASLFILPLMFQIGFGLSPFSSGLLMLVGAVGSLSTKAIAIGVVRRFGFRHVLIANSALIALATLLCGCLYADMPIAVPAAVMVLCGFTRSLQFTCLNTLGFADMPPERISAASMLTSMLQQVVMGIAVGCAAVLLRVSVALHGGHALGAIDFRYVLVTLACIASLAVVRFVHLEKAAGAEISGRVA
jgi:EmrB/QacA subfamily drug resistance transporter